GSAELLRAGSRPVPVPRSHCPSDWPGVLTHRNASARGSPVLVVGRSPRPRSGGLHQTCGSGQVTPAGAAHGPAPLRLVSTTKCASLSGATVPTFWSYQASVRPHVLKSLGLAGKYWLA